MRIAAALVAATALTVVVATTIPAAEAAPKPKQVLVVSHTASFRHSSIPVVEKVLSDMAATTGLYEVDFARNAEEVQTKLTDASLRNYHAVVFNNTTGNLGEEPLRALLAWLKKGKGFVGIHAATDTYHPDQIGGDRSYIDMIGGEFATHGNQAKVDAYVEVKNHPATWHLGDVWTVTDEIYIFKENTRDQVRVLLALKENPQDGRPGAGEPGDHLIAWTDDYGRGRVFSTALGHREDVVESYDFREHLLGGLLWSMKMTDFKPVDYYSLKKFETR